MLTNMNLILRYKFEFYLNKRLTFSFCQLLKDLLVQALELIFSKQVYSSFITESIMM